MKVFTLESPYICESCVRDINELVMPRIMLDYELSVTEAIDPNVAQDCAICGEGIMDALTNGPVKP